ncbi:MAG: Tfx family DNA-binding protein [Halobacteriales archaeon]|nr:Tfx family DNA-binding protein [Halobacteriales archaeon]
MTDRAPDAADTFLTERQAEVLERRREGLTQREIAERLGTTVPNISAIERAARDNVERARRTVDLANRIETDVWFEQGAGDHLRDVVEAIYEAGDEAGVKITYSDPELAAYLHVHLGDRLDGRRLTDPVEVGITPDGGVVTYGPDPG